MLRSLFGMSSPTTAWAYLGLVTLSALLQTAALIMLFPALTRLFSPTPASAGPWVVAVLATIALVWLVDRWAAVQGLNLGIGLMHTIHRRTPATLLQPAITGPVTDVAAIRRLAAMGSIEATSGVILLITPLVNAWLVLVFLGVGLFFIHPVIGVVTTVVGALALAGVFIAFRLQREVEAAYRESTAALDDRLFEFAWAQATWRTSTAVTSGANAVSQAIDRTRRHALRLACWQIPNELVFSVVIQLALVAIGASTWWAYRQGGLTGVEAAVMVIIALRLIEQVTLLSVSTTSLLGMRATLATVQHMVDPEPDVPAPVTEPPELTVDQVGVTLARDGQPAQVLDGIDVQCAPGTVTVIVGPSGSGKTTLGRVMAGLHPPSSGQVKLNGQAVTAGQLRAATTMVCQSTHLSSGPIEDNLRAVNPNLTTAQRDTIANATQLTSVIAGLPDGWASPVGELGTQLSGGERQRVGLARALSKPASMLVVDEATSALDTQHEQAIVSAINERRANYTTIVISHRPAWLTIADQVLVVEHGRIVESGPPEELINAGGRLSAYTRQWSAAASWQPPR